MSEQFPYILHQLQNPINQLKESLCDFDVQELNSISTMMNEVLDLTNQAIEDKEPEDLIEIFANEVKSFKEGLEQREFSFVMNSSFLGENISLTVFIKVLFNLQDDPYGSIDSWYDIDCLRI
ncbi:MAG: hypothetical protein HQ565_12515, partial [Bacteroidetes bacterium]|nr:hypothetical protein [Bacteroidota bacterium]